MRFWFVVPAAGAGRRFGGDLPKQYFPLAGRRIIEHTLERLLSLRPAGIVVAVDPADTLWAALSVSKHPLIRSVHGGGERADSVGLALGALETELGADDWVLVHDVARPCVAVADISNLLRELADSSVGGILAAPVSDTLKRGDGDNRIERTEDRSRYWAALTPQMFRFGLLRRALAQCRERGIVVTDEAMAVETLGLRPALVAGGRDNIKITHREDIAIAEAILDWQSRGDGETARSEGEGEP